MKIFLMWPDKVPEMRTLFEKITSERHEVVYWVGLRGGEHYAPKGTIFHDHFDAWDGKRAEALLNARLKPPSTALIEALYRTESITLTMMNKHFDTAPVDERKHIYYDMVGYWNGVLDHTQPDVIIFSIVPHTVYNYIVYELAKMRGIPTLCFEDTWVALRLIPFSDFWKGSDELREAIARRRKKKNELSKLGSELQTYYKEHVQVKPGAIPSYITEQKNKAKGMGLFFHRIEIASRTLKDGTFFTLALAFLMRLVRKDLEDEYRSLEKNPDLSRPFIYFPLSFQPERTTSPQGDVFHDQILAVETLAAATPAGWFIYVKEHPAQWWVRTKTRFSSTRYRGYYKRLSRIRNVILVPPESSSFELLKSSKTVATVTGTAGWEALLAGKRPLIFGIPWYRDCPGLFFVRSSADCARALAEMSNEPSSSQDDILAYLKGLEDVTLKAHIGIPPAESPIVGAEENMRTIAQYICKELPLMRR